MSSIITHSTPSPLITLHMLPEKYDAAEKICKTMQKKGFPPAQFDRMRHAIHFPCSIEIVHLMFERSGHKEYVPEMMNLGESSKCGDGFLLPPSQNGTLLEMRMDSTLPYVQEALAALRKKSSFDVAFENWLKAFGAINPGMPPIQNREDLEKAKEEFSQMGSIFLSKFEPMYQLLSTHTFDQLETLADAVHGQEAPHALDLRATQSNEQAVPQPLNHTSKEIEAEAQVLGDKTCAAKEEVEIEAAP